MMRGQRCHCRQEDVFVDPASSLPTDGDPNPRCVSDGRVIEEAMTDAKGRE